MTAGERIKILREKIGITQEEFSRRLGTTRNTITNYEANRRMPMDATIKSICREFNVSETWLRTGEGEMLVPNTASELEALAKKYDLSHDARILVEEFVNLKPEIQQVFVDFARKAAVSFRPEPTAPATISKTKTITHTLNTPVQERTEPDLATKVEELERQNQEKDKQLQELASQIKDQKSQMDAAKEIEPDVQKLDGEELTTEEEEALYRSSSGYVANADLSVLNTTDDTGSSGTKLA